MTRLLAGLLLAAALLLALHGALAPRLFPRADLRWAVVNELVLPQTDDESLHGRYGAGFSLLLANEGRAESGEVRLLLERVPDHVDVRWTEGYALTPTAEGLAVALDPLAPGARVRIDLYGATPYDLEEVREGGRPVPEAEPDLWRLAPRPWLPRWAVLALGLLFAGLALRTLALPGRA